MVNIMVKVAVSNVDKIVVEVTFVDVVKIKFMDWVKAMDVRV